MIDSIDWFQWIVIIDSKLGTSEQVISLASDNIEHDGVLLYITKAKHVPQQVSKRNSLKGNSKSNDL